MSRAMFVISMVLLAGCTTSPHPDGIVFLSRDGCVNTPLMRSNLEAALVLMGQPADAYEFVDLGRLPGADLRAGYPTPTVLLGGADIFGMPAPTPPLPSPT